jgi:RNA polymerase sigma-70 factor (ECF subfamily)
MTTIVATHDQATGVAVLAPGPTADDERSLVERAQVGDREAFGELYRRHRPAVVGYLRDHMRDDAEVEDIAAEAFVRALDAIDTFRTEQAGFATWLTGITRHLMLERWRRQKRHPELEMVPEWNPALTADPEEVACLRLELARLLARLTPRARRVLVLQCMAGLTRDEAARTVGLSTSMIRFLTSQARATLTEKPNWAAPAGQKGARAFPPALCACGCGVELPADRRVTPGAGAASCRRAACGGPGAAALPTSTCPARWRVGWPSADSRQPLDLPWRSK